MKSTPLKSNAALRHTAKKRLRAVPPAGEAQSLPDLRSALGELRRYEAELGIQNEELRDSRAQIEESHKNYFRHFDLAPVALMRLNHKRQTLERNILAVHIPDQKHRLLKSLPVRVPP